jgi:hypothetical protein
VTWLLPPGLDDGEEPELKPPELFELEFDPVELEPEEELEPEDVEPEEELAPELVEPEDVEPELAEPVDVEPEDVEPVEVEALACVDPGRTSANAPAAATPATAIAVVAVLTLSRPRSLAAMAWRTPSSFVLLMSFSLGSRTRSFLRGPSP